MGDIVEVTFHRYPEKNVPPPLLTRRASRPARRRREGAAGRAIDVAAVRWAATGDLRDEDFPPADVAVLAKVRAILARAGMHGYGAGP